MSDEVTPEQSAPAPAARKAAAARVVLATDPSHTFGLGDLEVTEHGTEVTSDQADSIRTAALKMGINITVKEV